MSGYQAVRDRLRDDGGAFERLDAAQLVKHALGLRTAVHGLNGRRGKRPILLYLYAEPRSWPDGRIIDHADLEEHRAEIARFAAAVDGDEVGFRSASYGELLATWLGSHDDTIRAHALALADRFRLR
jgi:hypothetical protein